MTTPSRLEIFPDELFLDLFSYIPARDLYHVWHGLNHRLTAILLSVQISFDFNESTQTNIRALNYFSQQIVYIHLRASYQSFDLKQFPGLRSLIVDTNLMAEQLDTIRPTILPHLRRLTFSEWWKEDDRLNDVIFNKQSSRNENSSWLKVYHLPSMPDYFLRNSSRLSSVQTMVFDRISLCDIHFVLFEQPLLRQLKATLVRWTPDDLTSKISLQNPNYQHKYLMCLHITLNTCNRLDDLYPLLSHLPCLRYLYLACDSLSMHDFKQLAFELNTRVPWLERFYCSFKQTYIADVTDLHRMSPLFRQLKCRKIQWSGGWYYHCVTTDNV